MSLTQNDFKKIKVLIREGVGNEIAKNNLVLFELFERRFATKDDLEGFATKEDLKNFATKEDLNDLWEKACRKFATKDDLNDLWEKACEKFATKEDFMKLQDLVVLINHKLDTEYKFIQKRGEENTKRINGHDREIQELKRTLGVAS